MHRKETYEIKKTIEIVLHIATIPIAEITIKKYAEAPRFSKDRVRDYCVYGVLKVRKINAQGKKIQEEYG